MDALPLVSLVVGHVQLAIARTGGDDDGTRLNRLAILQIQPIRSCRTIDTDDMTRDGQARTELLRLHLRAPSQCLTRDAGRKAQVVFYLRRRTCLATGRHAFDHDRVQAFRRRIHGCSQARRPATDNRASMNSTGLDGFGQAKAVGKLRRRGVSQQLVVHSDNHREHIGRKVETAHPFRGAGVRLGVEQPMRITVSNQKSLQPQRMCAVHRPDDDHASAARADKPDPPQDKRTHDDLADVGFGSDQAQKVGTLYPDKSRGYDRQAGHQDATLIEMIQLTAELMRRMCRHRTRLTVTVEIEDLNAAFEHEEEIDASLPLLEQQCTGGYIFFPAVLSNTLRQYFLW